MKKTSIRQLCLCMSLALVTAGGLAAQSLTQRFDVPFQFQVGKQVLPAGTYSFIQRAGSPRLEITDGAKKTVAAVPVITRISARPGSEKGGRLVFDKVGEERFLSELWPVGMDGLVLRATSEDHHHETVEAVSR